MVNEGKLNIKASLISVRRSSTPPPSSTEATESLAKAFNWEHVPGRPKDSGKLICHRREKHEKQTNLEEDDDDDVYSDALETLSPNVSGVSGMDNLIANKSTDKQAQDFMMNRFLPAAKAMTIQPLQHAPRKKSVLVEQPRDFTKFVRKEKKSLVNRHITDIIPYTSQCQEEMEQQEEESDHEIDDYANISAKGCGLFPHSCIKNSLCLLNSVPETKIGNQFPLCSPYEVGKPKKSSHYRSAPAIKRAWDAIHKSKSGSSGSNRYGTHSGEMNHRVRLASFRRSRAAATVIGTRLLGDSKQAENNQFGVSKFPRREHTIIQEVLSQGSKRSSNSRSLSMEKTLYIDTASTVKSPCSNSYALVQALEENLDCEVLSSTDANSVTLSSMLSLMAKEYEDERLITDKEMNQEHMSLQLVQSSLKKDTKMNNNNNNNNQIVLVDGKCVLPPPLPKSPSESWLCHALPLVSLKNSFRYSNQGTQCHAKRQETNKASGYSKWETIVKTSKFES